MVFSDFGAQENKICHCFHLCRSLNLLISSKRNLLTGKMGEIIPATWSYENWMKCHSKSWIFWEWRSNLSRVVGESPEFGRVTPRSSPEPCGRELGSWCYRGLQVGWGAGENWVTQMGFESRKMIQKWSENLSLWASIWHVIPTENAPLLEQGFSRFSLEGKERGWGSGTLGPPFTSCFLNGGYR